VVALSLVTAMGISAYLTVPFTTMSLLVMFTLFGVAVDDIIVVVHTYERTDANKSIEERIVQSLQESGTAITLTSATSLVALLCAATCPILNIRFFCVTASLGILSVFVFQMTLFLPLFVLDERRRERLRRECCLSVCFGNYRRQDVEFSADSMDSRYSYSQKAMQYVTAPSVGGGCGMVQGYARMVSNSKVLQASVTFVFLLLSGFAVYGCIQADTEADLTDYYIDNSFMKEYHSARRQFWSSSVPGFMLIEHQDEGLFSESRRAEIDGIFSKFADLSFTFQPDSNWLRDFDTWLNMTSSSPAALASTRASLQGDAIAFGSKVQQFLDVIKVTLPGTDIPMEPWRHKKDVILQDGKVKYSRLELKYDGDPRVQETYINNWKTTFNLFFPDGPSSHTWSPADVSKGGLVKHVWVYAPIARSAERDAEIKEIIFVNLAIACTAVGLTVMLLLNPLVGLFVGVLVALLDAMVLGLLTLYTVKLDFVAFLCLSMTIGLVVDYATHTSHAYLHCNGEPDEKLFNSISQMGAAVLSGGGSTLLGIAVLGFASSKGFRNFFYVLGTAIFMGTAVGIVVSPVLLRCLHGIGRSILRIAFRSKDCKAVADTSDS